MVESKFSLEKKLNFKISLSYSGTLNDTTEIINDNPIYNLISSYDEIKKIIKEKKLEKMKFFYLNRKKINELIYEQEEVIEINSGIIQKKYSECFYLSLLIEENYDIINYKYNLKFIKEVNDLFKGTNNDLMMSKIILILIKNFKGIDEYDEKYEKEIDKLEQTNLERIKNNINILKDLNMNFEDIINKKIEEIYTEIIMNLIKTNKIDDITYANNIIKQLDLENIYITKIMYDGLAGVLIPDKNYMKKYIISDKENLYNDEIINFYYILFKYILKKPIYIYQIEFLYKIRETIFKIIKNNIEKYKNDNLEYIIDFFTNSYYSFLLKKINIKKGKSKSKYADNYTTKSRSHFSQSVQTTSTSFDNDNNSIIKFEKNIENSNRDNYTRLIREMSNGDIIRLHNINDITLYKKGEEQPIIIKHDSISSSQREMTTNLNTKNRINLEELKNNESLQVNKSIHNIIETNESKEKKDKNFIQIMECSKEGLIIYKLSNDQKVIVNTLKLSCSGCFEIKDNSYVVIGEKGIAHYKDLNSLEAFEIKYDKVKDNAKDKDKCKLKDLPFRGCIKINDNYIALTSNSILPYGEDLLFIYDANTKELIKRINNYSFIVGVNGLSLMDISEEDDENQKENQILLCACKKYTNSQKNGILIIDTNNIKEKEELYYTFCDTYDFEVSCICPLKILKDNKMQATNYFLAGGLDEERRQGIIKLYKIQYNEKDKKDKIKIEELQDIVIENNDSFTGFNSNIECMIQCQRDGKIYVSSSDGNLALFSEPNLDYYLEENQILEELKNKFS